MHVYYNPHMDTHTCTRINVNTAWWWAAWSVLDLHSVILVSNGTFCVCSCTGDWRNSWPAKDARWPSPARSHDTGSQVPWLMIYHCCILQSEVIIIIITLTATSQFTVNDKLLSQQLWSEYRTDFSCYFVFTLLPVSPTMIPLVCHFRL